LDKPRECFQADGAIMVDHLKAILRGVCDENPRRFWIKRAVIE
jgi:hypothetical protein